jgi:hypothetical protein
VNEMSGQKTRQDNGFCRQADGTDLLLTTYELTQVSRAVLSLTLQDSYSLVQRHLEESLLLRKLTKKRTQCDGNMVSQVEGSVWLY